MIEINVREHSHDEEKTTMLFNVDHIITCKKVDKLSGHDNKSIDYYLVIELINGKKKEYRFTSKTERNKIYKFIQGVDNE